MSKSNIIAIASPPASEFDADAVRHQRFKVYTAKQLDQIPQLQQLSAERQAELAALFPRFPALSGSLKTV